VVLWTASEAEVGKKRRKRGGGGVGALKQEPSACVVHSHLAHVQPVFFGERGACVCDTGAGVLGCGFLWKKNESFESEKKVRAWHTKNGCPLKFTFSTSCEPVLNLGACLLPRLSLPMHAWITGEEFALGEYARASTHQCCSH
jgi:hypothetical protein